MPLRLVCVSFVRRTHALWEEKCVFLRPQVCGGGEFVLCVPSLAWIIGEES